MSICFNGEPGLAARRARKGLQALRRPDNTYVELVVELPDSESSTRAFAGPDKNLRQLLTEQATKKATSILKELHPRLSRFPLKRDGVVCVGWEKCVLVSPQSDKSIELKFNAEVVQKFGINKEETRARFETAWAPSAESIPWSL